jgi:parallel beta-helix repeat protein
VEVRDSYAFVRRNTIRFLHGQEVETCVSLCAADSVANGLPAHYATTFGIGVEGGAEADIIRNAIRSGPCAALSPEAVAAVPAGPGCLPTPRLFAGIMHSMLDSDETNRVHHNAIWRTELAVLASPDADGASYTENHITTSNAGFYMHSSDGQFRDNNVEGNDAGIIMNGSATGNDIQDNDFRGNSSDCNDVSSGAGTAGTANLWDDNLGDTSNPAGICSST